MVSTTPGSAVSDRKQMAYTESTDQYCSEVAVEQTYKGGDYSTAAGAADESNRMGRPGAGSQIRKEDIPNLSRLK